MNSTKQASQRGGAGLFVILALFFLGISIWQTGIGYERMFGGHLSWMFSFAIGLMMLYLSFLMRNRRIQDENSIGPFIGYIACAVFCFFGNFNAIYSHYHGEELVTQELTQKKNDLTSMISSAVEALENCDSTTERNRNVILEHKKQLIAQLTDPARPGKDKRAFKEIAKIEELLGEELTDLGGTPQQMADGYSRNIDNILATRFSNSKHDQAQIRIDSLKSARTKLDALIVGVSQSPNVVEDGLAVITKVVDAINTIAEETKNFLGSDSEFKHQAVAAENLALGKMSHTFSSAFNGRNGTAAWLSVTVAFGIDALVPFVVFVSTGRRGGNRRGNGGFQELKSNGVGLVIIR